MRRMTSIFFRRRPATINRAVIAAAINRTKSTGKISVVDRRAATAMTSGFCGISQPVARMHTSVGWQPPYNISENMSENEVVEIMKDDSFWYFGGYKRTLILEKHWDLMLNHIHLCNRALAFSIMNNANFLRGYVMYIIKNNKIDSLCKLVESNPMIADTMLNVDDQLQNELLKYYINNLDALKNSKTILQYAILKSELFCNLLAEKIIAGQFADVNVLDQNVINIMMNKLNEANINAMLKYHTEHSLTMPIKLSQAIGNELVYGF